MLLLRKETLETVSTAEFPFLTEHLFPIVT